MKCDWKQFKHENLRGFGSRISLAILICSSVHAATNEGQVVVPQIYAEVDGGNLSGSSLLRDVMRLQDVYGASLFPSQPITIREVRLRPSAVYGTAFNCVVSNLQINLSTTPAVPEHLSTTFSNNVGANDTVVFHGAINLSSAFSGPANGPKAFDIIIPLTTPFRYDPAAGNLCVDWRNRSGSCATLVDAGSAGGDQSGRAFSL